MVKPISWSHSGLKDFENCARKFHEVKILKRYPREETEATLYGTRLHEQAELFIRDGRPVDPDFKFMQPMLDSLRRMQGVHYTELEMALRVDMTPCDFKAPDVWVRGIADLVVVDSENRTARIFDYKSGGDKYPDTTQLELMALLLFKFFPEVTYVTAGLLFVLKGTVQKCRVSRDDEAHLWQSYRERVGRIEGAFTSGVWNPKQSGLCKKYCVVTSCEFNGRN
jgi:PD-(D/E)XK nuclease superfamily